MAINTIKDNASDVFALMISQLLNYTGAQTRRTMECEMFGHVIRRQQRAAFVRYIRT